MNRTAPTRNSLRTKKFTVINFFPRSGMLFDRNINRESRQTTAVLEGV